MPSLPHVCGRRISNAQFPPVFLDLVPRAGLLSNVFAVMPRDILAHPGDISGLSLSSEDSSPLQWVSALGSEAQAAWVYWLFKSCSPNIRRNLIAGHAAWQSIERARKKTVQVDH